MKEKKSIIIAVVILLLVLVGAVGASYAYFATTTKTTGNDKNLNIVTENLGDIKWEGTKVYTSGDLLPGECGIQTFTIEKNSASGKGIYEIDLKGMLDESFGTDVEITLYKSTNPTTNNVTIKEGNSTISGDTTKQYYKEDSVVLNGTPEKVYGAKSLQNKDKIILEQADFDNSTLQKTTYYLVYCYKNNGNQDKQQGKSFSGEISVRLILEKGSQEEDGPQGLAKDIITLAKTDTTNLAVDDYGNTRYIGSNPNNYVSIDGDIWRIIGIMKDVDDGTGNKEDRVKIIRASSIGSYSWDTSASGDSSLNSGMGVNEWSQADLMKLLNSGYESESVGGSLYWNKKSGTCYTGHGDTTSSCSFTSSGINDKLKLLIGDAVWNTGATNSSYLAAKLYQSERENDTGKKCTVGSTWCTDTVTRTATWNGKLAIMYPSDYGYATSRGSTTDRATCLNTSLDTWGNYSECYNNDWLYDGNTQWFLNPVALASYAVFGNYLIYGSVIYNNSGDTAVFKNYDIKPTTYLLSNVSIKSGDGTSSNPFILE